MNSTRRWLPSVVTLTAALLLAVSQTAAEESPAKNLAIIAVRNYAGVDDETLAKAEAVATGIFRKAGVEVRWVDLPLDSVDQPEASTSHDRPSFQIQVGIIPAGMACRLHMPKNVMGFAPGTGPARQIVYVFYGSVEALAKRQKAARIKGKVLRYATKAQILGTMIGHEMGHVLLNLPSHSSTGIMRGNWDLEDLQQVAFGSLLFTGHQSEVIRAEVARRVGQRKAVEVAPLELSAETIVGEDGYDRATER